MTEEGRDGGTKSPVNSESVGEAPNAHATCPTQSRLADLAALLEDSVEVKDRRYRLKIYRQSFLGSDAVDVLHKALLQIDPKFTRENAILCGRYLETKYNLFHHVCNDHILKDDYLMYRFRSPRDRRVPSSSEDEKDKDFLDRLLKNEGDIFMEQIESQRSQEFQALCFLADAVAPSDSSRSTRQKRWKMKRDRARKQKGKGSPRSPTSPIRPRIRFGSKSSSLSDSQSMSSNSEEFGVDSPPVSPTPSITTSALSSKNSSSLESSFTDSFSMFSVDDFDDDIDLDATAVAFEIGVGVKTNRYRGKRYPKTFVGTDGVEFLASYLGVSRSTAVQVGKKMNEKMKLFVHVTNDHGKDDRFHRQQKCTEPLFPNVSFLFPLNRVRR